MGSCYDPGGGGAPQICSFHVLSVIKNEQIQGNLRLRLKGVTLTKNLTSQQSSKIENMINDLRRENK